MNIGSLRRLRAGLLLALLFAGPVGPLGAWHVAHVDPALSHDVTLGAAGEAKAVGHGPACAVCHFLTGLRVTAAAWPVLAAPPSASGVLPARIAPVLHVLALTGDSAGRSPPSC